MKAALLLLALLCLAPGASSSFSASALDVQWTNLQGQPSALSYIPDDAGDSFELRADAVRLESDWTRLIAFSEAGHETSPTKTDVLEHGKSVWTAKAWDPASSLFLVPGAATIAAEDGEGLVALPLGECVAQQTYFEGPRTPACPTTGTSLQLSGTATDWIIDGNFTLVLWDWEGQITTATGTSSFWTGTRPTETSVAGFGEIEMRQAFLSVVNGHLRLASGARLDAYVTTLELATPNATEPKLTSEAGEIVGTLTEGTMWLQRGGEPPLKPNTISNDSMEWNRWPLGALAATALLLPIGLVHARRQGAVVHLTLANKNMEMQNPLAAARHAAKAARVRHQKVEANVLGAIASMEGRDFDGAQQFLHRLHSLRIHDEAACRYLLAHMRIQQGRNEEGQRLVEECLALDPSYDIEVASNPVLAPFLDPSKWPRGLE